ncbi:MAG TPA: NAD-dependent epimerase/dehydratase family protein [Ideonella sp.]|uniref:NAD-dependent epimerase/dehydratase family protein n=1 Tax=Ideonella sp. TaxID=1929293 RepID=UPI002E33192C|nr:NAD-dependent epimerase/dehydratase family protein [Ideonella sp.]HEX5686725.1 NAD-dependent epimerase/dehydratase family protein [Ideonella sp.]
MARVLLTGGCGFIGANLAPMLRARGHEVRILDNLSRGRVEFLDDRAAYEVVQADIRDESAVIAACDGRDAVVHLAAYGSVVESVAEPSENFSINVEGTFKVLNAARQAGVQRVVFASTGGALIGNATPPVNEGALPRPISPYGASKLAGEGYCCAFAEAYGMSVTALRFANVIGPISWHKKGAVTAFFKAIMNGDPIRIYGDGSATRDFLYVEDLCRGIVAGLEAALPRFNVFHLASGRETSVRELAEIACRVGGRPEHPIVHDLKRPGEVERNFATYDLAREQLGFGPSVSIEDAMARTWAWMQEQPR